LLIRTGETGCSRKIFLGSNTRTSVGEWAARIGLVVFAVALTLVILELALSLGALFVQSRPISISEGRGTILTLGDSHTYGVHTEPDESYPGQLQTVLNERAPGRYNVVNLGVPGTNSAEIAARLPGWIARYRPFAVIVCVGMNNRWNFSDTRDTQESKRLGPVVIWLADLRLMRLYHLLSLNLRNAFFAPERAERPQLVRTIIDGDDARVEHRDARTGEIVARHEGAPKTSSNRYSAIRRLHQDIDRMHLITEQRNVQLMLLTYSAFFIPGASPGMDFPTVLSQELRKLSKAYDLQLIDTHDRFRELLTHNGNVPRRTYFLSNRDDHPNPAGYAEIAALVADAFEPR
jgi:lysophospholipase L1-like esterase